jgi:hypothetical protein
MSRILDKTKTTKPNKQNKMQILRCKIAGIPHRKPEKLPAVGDLVTLVPEPDNAFDANAVKVIWNGVHLGYIPKTETSTVRTFNLTEMRVVEVEPLRKWDEVYIESIE